MRGCMYLLWILIILPHICASQYLHGGPTNGVDMATSPLEPVPDTMHPRFVMVHTDVHVLLLNSSASQKFPNAVSNILAVADSVQSNAKVRSALYCTFTYTVLDVDQSNVEKPSPAYISSEDIIQEIVSTVPTQFAELPIMDPINTTTSTRQMDPAVVYLFPTLGQQFFVLSDYMTHKSSSKVIYPVFREDGVLNHAALLESLTLSMQYFDLTPGPLSTFTSTVVAALHSSGVNVVVGLTQADLVPLVLFLDTHPLAKVMVIFDEFTLLYDELLDAFGKSHRASMDRLLYATNLPRWTIPPTDNRAVVLSLFFRTFDKSLWTPAALRTFLTTFVMDTLSHGVGHIYKKNLVDAVYSGHPISIDSSISFGPFRSSCYAPSLYPAYCLVNYGARDIRLWSLSSAFDSSVSSLYGPVLVHMTLDGKGGLEMALWVDPLDVFLVVVYAVVFLHLIAFGILIYLGFRTSVLDADDEVATVLYVRILHRGNSKSDQSEICRHFEDLLDKMLDTYNFERLESTDDSCVLVAHSASTAIQFAQTLHDEFFLNGECRDMATGAELSIGLHSGLCAAARAVEAQDGMMLASAIAPIVLLASCVSRLCTESVTLVTRWTLEAVRLEKVLLPFEPHLVGKYRLDDEDTLISVYRMRALPMKDANGSPCSSFECSSQKMADNPLTAVASFEARDSV